MRTNFKAMLKVFAWDSLSHYQWGSVFATIAALIAVVVSEQMFQLALPLAALSGALASALTAVSFGFAGEQSDKQTNAEEGLQMREVSRRDIRSTALGCLPSALPLLALFFASRMG